MTLTFPLDVTDFASLMRKMSIKFWLADAMESSGLGSGQFVVADLAPKYWCAEIGLINMANNDAMAMQALIQALDGGINPFFLYDPRAAYPQYDPDGSILGAADVQILEVRTNNKEIKLENLPVGYKLKRGDMFSFDFGSGGIYRALHQLVSGDTADGFGKTGWLEFRPHLADPTISPGKNINLIMPSAQMKLIPGSFDPGMARQMMTTGMALKCRQVFQG